MVDQKQFWNERIAKGKIDHLSDDPSEFAKEVLEIIPANSKILELGCGVANDSVWFTKAGHKILSTDFSENAIEKNKVRFSDIENLEFNILDISEPFQFADNEFDVVYARLSLHYFTDFVTKKIFREIHRVLKNEGYLCFVCKTVDDPSFGQGEEIEKNMFVHNGHIRHLFTEEYVEELAKDGFVIEKMESGEVIFYGDKSAFINVILRVKK